MYYGTFKKKHHPLVRKQACTCMSFYEVCFRARNWQLQASPRVAKCGDFWTEKHSIFGNFKVLPLLANSITRCLMNAQHSISDSLMLLPKLATSIIRSQHIQIWQNLHSVFIVLSITFHCGFWFPFLENCEFSPNLASIMKKPKPTM